MVKQGSLPEYLMVTLAAAKDEIMNIKIVNLIREDVRFQNSSQET